MSNIDTLDLPAETSSSANTLIESQQPDERQEADIADDASTPEARFEEKPRIVTRYSREELLALQKSPLITRPDTLPALSAWFGEYPNKENNRRGTDGTDSEKQRPSKSISTGNRDENALAIASKIIPTGPMSPRSADKIVLGPPKMNFASSTTGGLRQSEEKLLPPVAKTTGAPSAATGPRQRQGDETKLVKDAVNGKDRTEPRAPRGPSSLGERGFSGRERSAATGQICAIREKDGRSISEKGYSREGQALPGGEAGGRTLRSRQADSIRNNRREGEREHGPITGRYFTKEGSHRENDHRGEKTPEWMDYNPEKEEMEVKRASKEADSKDADGKEFINDLEAWKARMKEQDRREKEKLRRESESKIERYNSREPSRADSVSWRADKTVEGTKRDEDFINGRHDDTASLAYNNSQGSQSRKAASNIDKLFGPGGIALGSPLDPSSAFDKFLLQHNTAIADETTAVTLTVTQPKVIDVEAANREQGGSRFARFFSSKSNGEDERGQPQHHDADVDMSHGKPISLETLFQSQSHTTSPLLPSASVGPASPPNITAARRPSQGRRMLSEEEVLVSMGARHVVKKPEEPKDADDVVGFNMILQALAKGKPVAEQPNRSSMSTVDSSNSYLSGQSTLSLDPSIISAQNNVKIPTSSKAGNYTLAPFPNDPSILGVPAIAPSNSSRSISPQLAQLPNDPSIIMAKKPDFRPQNVGEGRDARGITIPESRSTTSEYVQKPRPAINSLFAGNLPTSVLRQLSTKSTDTSSRHSSSTSSPMFNKLHPVASKVSSNVPLASTNAILSPPLSMAPIPPPLQQGGQFSQSPGYYQRLPPQALSSQSLSAVHNHPTDVSQQAIGRNIPVDQFLGMAGPPLSHMRNPSPLPLHLQHQQLPRGSIQGGPMPPIHMFQQQQFDRFPPHMLPPGPLQLPGPGPLLPHLQHGGGMQSRLPMHPDMMPPPDMLQASMAGYANMIPPNLMNSGLPGGPGLPPHFFQHGPGMPPPVVNMNSRMVYEEYERGGGPRS